MADACIQTTFSLQILTANQRISEDCLYMDIYVDGDKIDPTAKKPVVIFIHGGGFTIGSSSIYNLTEVVRKQGIIGVSIQYRLGLLGFAQSADQKSIPGNLGLRDQVAAIKWVKNYISSFGGDPNSISLQGESAGSISIVYHMLTPLLKNEFRTAILESGAQSTMKLISSAEIKKNMEKLIEVTKCKKPSVDYYECLRYLSVDEIIKAQVELQKKHSIQFLPSIDSVYFADQNPVDQVKAGNFSTKLQSVLIGHNGNEGGMFLTFFAPKIFPMDRNPPIKYIWKFEMKAAIFRTPKASRLSSSKLIDLTYGKRMVLSSIEVANKLGKILGDMSFACPQYHLVDSILKFSPETKVFYYHFLVRPALKKTKMFPYIEEAVHSDEIQFVFGFPFTQKSQYTGAEIELSKLMVDNWASMVRNGTVLDERWQQTSFIGGKTVFNHLLIAEPTRIVSQKGFPPNICDQVPDDEYSIFN